jgi:diadenosine tetraphosphatase ApaH/serine/threonine PP2A family protein phosphatase
MKTALVSDIHGNLEALKAVFADLRSRGVERVYSLGDVVGYGPEPEGCLELLRREAEVQLMGNHDAAVLEMTSVADFNENARLAVEWSRKVMAEESLDFMRDLPYVARRDGFLLVHSSPEEPPAWHYILSLGGARRSFEHFSERACFIGHTHVPFVITRRPDGVVEEVTDRPVEFEEGCRYLVNVGSVGQPRDRDPRASYAIVDAAAGALEIRRVHYPVEKTQQLMRDRGLPPFLIERLAVGR